MAIPEMFSRLPPALAAKFQTARPNDRVTLHQGPVRLTSKGTTIDGNGDVYLRWLPSPNIELSVRWSGSFQQAQGLMDGKEEVLADAVGMEGRVVVFQLGGLILHSGDQVDLRVRPHEQLRSGRPELAHRLCFHVFNSNLKQGIGVRHPAVSHTLTTGTRVELNDDFFAITLDTVPGLGDLTQELDEVGGYAITHAGTAIRRDGKRFTTESYDDMRMCLFYFLSFVRGAWSNSVLWYGYDHSGAETFVDWYSPSGEPWRKQARSWIGEGLRVSDVQQLYPSFARRFHDPKWKETVRTAVHWYCECNGRPDVNGAIVLTQAALELLAWVILVDSEAVISADGFEKLPAADKVRLLIRGAALPFPIPASHTHLAQVAVAENWSDGPQAFTGIRNTLVHPGKKNLERFARVTPHAKYHAMQLGLWYVEMVLLKLFDYNGWYSNRLFPGAEERHQFVPWASPQS